ncbi:MAG: 23S rRNA (uracil(1939)-C(5))-methyltransferase RlmD [bacterium]|nr:23S rRNA (uracil(1939)-C(5))-methyltransferase RlmD [bacterium]
MIQSPITLKIEKLVYKGLGIARWEKWTVFVPNVYPGDEIEAEVIQKKRRHVMAKCTKVITSSPLRETASCPHYPDCGGCQMLDVNYENQLKLKRDIISDCFTRDHADLIPNILPVIPSPQHTYYRNKMDFAFGSLDGKLILGLKRRGQFDQVIPITDCMLLDPESNLINAWIVAKFRALNLSAWDPNSHTGLLRHLIVRQSKHKKQWMINLVCSAKHPELAETFAEALINEFPSICSVYLSINSTVSDTSFSEQVTHLAGEHHLKEQLGPFEFSISPYAFFQTNSKGAEVLYDLTRQAANVQASDTVMDLYCGTGTIGMYLAPHCKSVIGIEENPAAIQDAHKNATHNKIFNIEFIEGRVKNILKFNTFTPDVVVVDPPRSGMVPKALSRIIALNAPKLVVVSCNPNTLARDLIELRQAGYSPTLIQPVDMFPNTYHVECVVGLEKKIN